MQDYLSFVQQVFKKGGLQPPRRIFGAFGTWEDEGAPVFDLKRRKRPCTCCSCYVSEWAPHDGPCRSCPAEDECP